MYVDTHQSEVKTLNKSSIIHTEMKDHYAVDPSRCFDDWQFDLTGNK